MANDGVGLVFFEPLDKKKENNNDNNQIYESAVLSAENEINSLNFSEAGKILCGIGIDLLGSKKSQHLFLAGYVSAQQIPISPEILFPFKNEMDICLKTETNPVIANIFSSEPRNESTFLGKLASNPAAMEIISGFVYGIYDYISSKNDQKP